MAYDVSDVELYQWAEDQTFGATTVTHNIMGPRGKVGFVRDIIVEVTTAVTWSSMSAPAEIDVGISSGDFTFGRYRLGTSLSLGYTAGVHRASMEPWTGLPPRTLADFAGHVVLDGGPLTSQGIAGGSYGTVLPAGRIPAGPFIVTNVILGTTASSDRYYINGLTAAPGGLSVGQKVLVQGVVGANATANGVLTVAAVDTVSYQWVELTSQTFSGAYTNGGIMIPQICVTCKQGTGGSPAGGGIVRVKIQWLGPETV
jgi:hypothetical protein